MLPHALGHIIADTIAENMTGNLFFREIFALLANDRDHLALIINGLRNFWNKDGVKRAVHRSHGFGKPDLFARTFHAGFFDMVCIIKADGKYFAGTRHRSQQRDCA